MLHALKKLSSAANVLFSPIAQYILLFSPANDNKTPQASYPDLLNPNCDVTKLIVTLNENLTWYIPESTTCLMTSSPECLMSCSPEGFRLFCSPGSLLTKSCKKNERLVVGKKLLFGRKQTFYAVLWGWGSVLFARV